QVQALDEQRLDGIDRAEAVEHRAEAQGGEDDPHEHAGDAQALAQGGFQHLAGQSPLDQRHDSGGHGAHRGASPRLVMPSRNSPVMLKKMNSGAMPALSEASFSRRLMACRSSAAMVGPSVGLRRQRITT